MTLEKKRPDAKIRAVKGERMYIATNAMYIYVLRQKKIVLGHFMFRFLPSNKYKYYVYFFYKFIFIFLILSIIKVVTKK